MELTVKNDTAVISKEVCEQIVALEKQAKEIKAKQDEMKAKLQEAMEKYNVKKIENDMFVVSYVAEHDAERFDSKTFKTENPDIYDSYVKITKTSPSVRIKLK